MLFRKTTILTLFIILALTTLGQSKVDTTHVLELKNVKNYKEENLFWGDTTPTIRQEVVYNDPNMIDEEITQLLTIRFSHNSDLADNTLFDVVNDSALIKCIYQKFSVWNWSEKKMVITGQIRIIATTSKAIKIEFNLMVIDSGKSIMVYNGTRIFRKLKPKIYADGN